MGDLYNWDARTDHRKIILIIKDATHYHKGVLVEWIRRASPPWHNLYAHLLFSVNNLLEFELRLVIYLRILSRNYFQHLEYSPWVVWATQELWSNFLFEVPAEWPEQIYTMFENTVVVLHIQYILFLCFQALLGQIVMFELMLKLLCKLGFSDFDFGEVDRFFPLPIFGWASKHHVPIFCWFIVNDEYLFLIFVHNNLGVFL